MEKYLALGRDASSSGDPIAAESFFQHAEHYYRLLNADGFGDRGGGDRQRSPALPPPGEGGEAAGSQPAHEGAEPAL